MDIHYPAVFEPQEPKGSCLSINAQTEQRQGNPNMSSSILPRLILYAKC